MFETAVKEIDAVFKKFGTVRLGLEDVSHLEEEDEEEEERDLLRRHGRRGYRGRRLWDEQSKKEEE